MNSRMKSASTTAEERGHLANREGRRVEAWVEDFLLGCGVDVVRPTPDRDGWDQLWILPASQTEAVAMDRQLPETKCYVQLKKVAKGKRSVAVDLATWLRLVKRPEPTFIGAVVFDSRSKQVHGLHLFHIDEARITKVLERARKMSTGERPNKVKLSVAWNEDEVLYRHSEPEIIGYLRACTGNDPHAYALRKLELHDTVGNPDQLIEIELDTDDLTSLAVGLKPAAPATLKRVIDVRFGEHRVESEGDSSGELALHGPLPWAGSRLELHDESGTLHASLVGELLTSAALDVPADSHRIRFRAPHIEVNFRGKQMSAQFEINNGEWVRLDELAVAQKFFLGLCVGAETKRKLRIVTKDGVMEWGTLRRGDLKGGAVNDTAIRAHRIARRFDLPTDLRVRLGELEKHAKRIVALSQVLDAPPSLVAYVHGNDTPPIGAVTDIAHLGAAPLGEYVVVMMLVARDVVVGPPQDPTRPGMTLNAVPSLHAAWPVRRPDYDTFLAGPTIDDALSQYAATRPHEVSVLGWSVRSRPALQRP